MLSSTERTNVKIWQIEGSTNTDFYVKYMTAMNGNEKERARKRTQTDVHEENFQRGNTTVLFQQIYFTLEEG